MIVITIYARGLFLCRLFSGRNFTASVDITDSVYRPRLLDNTSNQLVVSNYLLCLNQVLSTNLINKRDRKEEVYTIPSNTLQSSLSNRAGMPKVTKIVTRLYI